MLGKTELNILRLVFDSLPDRIHSRGISKRSDISHEREVSLTKKLEKSGYLKSNKIGNMKLIQLNFSNPSVVKLCELFEIQRREEFSKKNKKSKLIIEDISKILQEKFKESLISSFIFGSFARGAEEPGDIDLILILHPQTKNIKENIDNLKNTIESRYGMTLSIAPMTTEDFRKNLWKKQPAIINAIKDRIILTGEEAFWNTYSSFLGGEYYGKESIS